MDPENTGMDMGFTPGHFLDFPPVPLGANHDSPLFDAVHGSPREDALAYSGQTTNFTCAVVSQQMILKQFGLEVSEAKLVYDATANGWLSESGTSMGDVGRLLEHYGVRTHSHLGGGLEALISELAHGHKVIAAVDSGELWGRDWFFEDWIQPEGADHALVVTGVDLSDPGHPMVYVNDPGEPGGAGKAYPLEAFLEAWNDSGRYFVATDEAPPGLLGHPVFGNGFNQDAGMYFDSEFWLGIAAKVGGAMAAAALSAVLEQVDVSDTIGNLVMMTVETLTDQQRNHIFNQL